MRKKLAKDILIELNNILVFSRQESQVSESDLKQDLQQPARALAQLNRERDKLKGMIAVLDVQSISASRPSGRYRTSTTTITVTGCGCNYGYRCERGGCTGDGYSYEQTEQVPVMEADMEARAIATAKLAKATFEFNQWEKTALPEMAKLKKLVAPLQEEINTLRKLVVCIDKARPILNGLIHFEGSFSKLDLSDKLIKLYPWLDEVLQDKFLTFLIVAEKKSKLFDSFITFLKDKNLKNLIPYKLFGMEKIGLYSRLEGYQFQLRLLNSDEYKYNNNFDSLRNKLVYLTVIESIETEIARLRDSDWFFMASPESTITNLLRLKASIQNSRSTQGKTYQTLIQSWLGEKTLSHFWQEETTVQSSIQTGRSPFAFFSCQSKTRTEEFIDNLEANYGQIHSPTF